MRLCPDGVAEAVFGLGSLGSTPLALPLKPSSRSSFPLN